VIGVPPADAAQVGPEVAVCHCGWRSSWRYRVAAQAAATWHVYEAHPDIWRGVIGDRPPLDPRPETVRYQPSAN
jgi:hypothetical protein